VIDLIAKLHAILSEKFLQYLAKDVNIITLKFIESLTYRYADLQILERKRRSSFRTVVRALTDKRPLG